MPEERYYTPAELADKMKVSSQTIIKLLKHRKLEGVKVGLQWRISETAWEQYLDRTSDDSR